MNTESKKRILNAIRSTEFFHIPKPDTLEINEATKINFENWKERINDFVKYRFSKHHELLSEAIVIKKEIEIVSSITFNSKDSDLRELYIEYLNNRLSNLNKIVTPLNENEDKNPHPNIFANEEGYKIFIKLKELLLNNSQRDYAYIFRKLQNEGFIWESLSTYYFQKWLKKEFNIDHINKKYHTLEELGESRINDYNHALLHSKQ